MLGNLKQKDPWGLLTSQSSFLDEFQANERICLEKKAEGTWGCPLAHSGTTQVQIWMRNTHVCTHTEFGFLNESPIQMFWRYPREDTAWKHPFRALVSGSPSCHSVAPTSCSPTHIPHWPSGVRFLGILPKSFLKITRKYENLLPSKSPLHLRELDSN